ncbi:30S ribosomal protein S17 [Candidatus Woesearchaeota archaeon]|nr:30S ribosomal protein S17 [Nanoarchaeota archaeon]MCB9369984.1 30S ribosomal protein S17 [Candidatus Woesearchaeota archaeon]USN44519.1 MAG: 30S ribosomal protein S17 [Candidatus Woesearchaeota archaeon]
MKKSVGYNIEYKPEEKTDDVHCPHFGSISVRGKVFEGVVSSDSMQKTVKVEWENTTKSTKYNRYLKTRTCVAAHNPDSIKAQKGDKVLIGETRPISKTKHFVVIKVLERALGGNQE